MSVESLTTEEKIGYLAAAATVLIALNGIQFWGEFSLGRILAAITVMMVARESPQAGILGGIGGWYCHGFGFWEGAVL